MLFLQILTRLVPLVIQISVQRSLLQWPHPLCTQITLQVTDHPIALLSFLHGIYGLWNDDTFICKLTYCLSPQSDHSSMQDSIYAVCVMAPSSVSRTVPDTWEVLNTYLCFNESWVYIAQSLWPHCSQSSIKDIRAHDFYNLSSLKKNPHSKSKIPECKTYSILCKH